MNVCRSARLRASQKLSGAVLGDRGGRGPLEFPMEVPSWRRWSAVDSFRYWDRGRLNLSLRIW
jgi:hypothetical protein